MSDFEENGKKIVHDRVNQILRAVAFEATSRIMERTPVRTGHARANWNTSVDDEDGAVDDGANVAVKLAQAKAVADAVEFAAGEKFVITNGVPYIGRLEAGSSTQAPAGMVALTFVELKPLVESIGEE